MKFAIPFFMSVFISLTASAAPQIEFDVVTDVPPVVQTAMSQYLNTHCGDFLSQAKDLMISEMFTSAGTHVSDGLTESQFRSIISIDYRPTGASVSKGTAVFMETAYYQYADGRVVIKPYVHTWPDICKSAQK